MTYSAGISYAGDRMRDTWARLAVSCRLSGVPGRSGKQQQQMPRRIYLEAKGPAKWKQSGHWRGRGSRGLQAGAVSWRRGG